MGNVTISNKEYLKLSEKAMRYEYIHQLLTEDLFVSPPEKSVKNIMKTFGASKKHSPHFLKSLEAGLRRSSYFKK